MGDKQASKDPGISKETNRALARISIVNLIKVVIEARNKDRAGRRFHGRMAQAKAAKVLGITPKDKPAPKPEAVRITPEPAPIPGDHDRPRKRSRREARVFRTLLIVFLAVLLFAVLLTAFWYFGWLGDGAGSTGSLPVAEATATAVPAMVDPTSLPPRVAYLRVETLQVDTTYGIWRRMPGIGIFLDDDGLGGSDAARQVTEEMVTEDGFLVAATTFEVRQYSVESYWVEVDETSLPLGCFVWQPRFDADADAGIKIRPWVVVRLFDSGEFNTTVVKFQIICGQEEVPVSTTSVVPNSTPMPPTDVPPTNPPPTDPPPTDPPPPTPEPTEVECNCETPETPVPTPTPMDATATPTR